MCMTVKNDGAASATSGIPRKEWNGFLQDFSRAHKGWLATLETADTVTKEIVETHEMSFQSIELDLEDEKHPRINVSVQTDNKTFKHILFDGTPPVQIGRAAHLHVGDGPMVRRYGLESMATIEQLRVSAASRVQSSR